MVTSGGEYGTGGFRKRAMCILNNCKVSNSKEKKKLIIEWVSYDMFSHEKFWEKKLFRTGGSCRDTTIMKVQSEMNHD